MTDRAAIQAAVDDLGLTVSRTFIPFSQSRNKDEKHRSLNWRVTVSKGGREILTTDYSAGIAHCPSYIKSVKALGGHNSVMRHEAIAFECEQGNEARPIGSGMLKGKSLEPDALDVLYSLVMDAGAIDHGNFESWAGDYGYDTDSRSAEKIYRDCLEIALKLRSAIGDEGLRVLQEAFQDF